VSTDNIGAGQTYTTIAGWTSSLPGAMTEPEIGNIVDGENFNEEVSLPSISGTTRTNYIELRADPSVRHSGVGNGGVTGTNHARIVGNSDPSQGRMIDLDSSFTYVTGLEVFLDSNGVSDEGIRILDGGRNAKIESCIIHGMNGANNQDGIYVGNWDVDNVRVYNCIIHNWDRAGLNLQNYSGTHNLYATVVNCLFESCGSFAEGNEDGGINIRESGSGETHCWVFNSAVFNAYSDEWQNTLAGSFYGRHNVDDGTTGGTAENEFDGGSSQNWTGVSLETNVSATGEVYTVTDLTDGSEDYTSKENDGSGTDRLAANGIPIYDLLIRDTFIAIDGTPIGSSYSPKVDVVGNGWTSSNYTDDTDTTGTAEIISNSLRINTNEFGAHIDCGETDHELDFIWRTGFGDNAIIVVVRRVDDANFMYYRLRELQADAALIEVSGDTETVLATTSQFFEDETNYRIRIEVIGNDYKLYIDETHISALDTTDATNNTGTEVGLYSLSPATTQEFFNFHVRGGSLINDVDIIGNSRDSSTPDIGPFEIQAGGGVTLTVQTALHALSSDSPVLTQSNTLAVQETLHALTSSEVTLSASVQLAVQEAIHSLTSDSPSLTQSNTLAIAEALHALSSDSPTLVQAHILAVADTLHALSSDSPNLTQAATLAIAETLHALVSDNVELSQSVLLAVANATHALTSDFSGESRSDAECSR